jgi:hypothetical protein
MKTKGHCAYHHSTTPDPNCRACQRVAGVVPEKVCPECGRTACRRVQYHTRNGEWPPATVSHRDLHNQKHVNTFTCDEGWVMDLKSPAPRREITAADLERWIKEVGDNANLMTGGIGEYLAARLNEFFNG